MNKVKLDYGYNCKPVDITWITFHSLLSKKYIKELPLIYERKTIGSIWLIVDHSINQIIDQILSFYTNQQSTLLINFDPVQYYIIKDGENSQLNTLISISHPIWTNTTMIQIIDDDNITNNKLKKINH